MKTRRAPRAMFTNRIKPISSETHTTANALTQHALQFLTDEGCYAWRNNTGAVRLPPYMTKKGHTRGARFLRFGKEGSSDILGLTPDGRFLAVEIKVGDDEMSDEQIEFFRQVKKRGGVAIEGKTLEDIEQQWRATSAKSTQGDANNGTKNKCTQSQAR